MPDQKSPTRREFLRDAMAATAAAGALTTMSCVNDVPDRVKDRRPPTWGIACRDAHLKEVGPASIWQSMDEIGVEGTEATVTLDGNCPGLFDGDGTHSIATPDGVKRLGEALAASRKKISAFCLHNRFDERADEELALARLTSNAAADLGVTAIRIDVVPRKIQEEEEFLRFSIDIGKRLVDMTSDTNVRFGVENHGGTTNKPDFLRRLFHGIGSKRYGSTLDTANFYWFGHPLSKLYDIYTEFAPWACHTHCKSINYPEPEREKQRERGWEYGKYNCPIYQGDIDFDRVADILRNAGYEGDLCIENESLGRFDESERARILKREADMLRDIARQSAQRMT